MSNADRARLDWLGGDWTRLREVYDVLSHHPDHAPANLRAAIDALAAKGAPPPGWTRADFAQALASEPSA